ncbi:hypothetical protein Paz_09 [Xylella phage Paz]|uniref:Uncharacterized protein n=1 Tax=Xylella phage Paz TaxID=1415145 RepID=V5Q8J0_9CAUD|nr:hypothetical protein Paz_09 [Xylella phage Paz]AHB12106.1 hypothetical protein Paz_09 [Xylella phage Paz]
MARDYGNYIRIAIPEAKVKVEAVHNALVKLIQAAGGSTAVEGWGSWVDGNGGLVTEKVIQYTWNFHSTTYIKVDMAARELVNALFRAGEQAVLKERYYDESIAVHTRTLIGYAARMLYAPTKH